MRKLSALCLAALFIASPVFADIPSATQVRATAEQLQNVERTYSLSNGRVLTLVRFDDRLYAELKGSRTELVPVAENVYASRDGSLSVTYKQDASSENGVVSVEGDRTLLDQTLPEQGRRSFRALR
jgi:hypothetical protein